jgi:hypothetical protein
MSFIQSVVACHTSPWNCTEIMCQESVSEYLSLPPVKDIKHLHSDLDLDVYNSSIGRDVYRNWRWVPICHHNWHHNLLQDILIRTSRYVLTLLCQLKHFYYPACCEKWRKG